MTLHSPRQALALLSLRWNVSPSIYRSSRRILAECGLGRAVRFMRRNRNIRHCGTSRRTRQIAALAAHRGSCGGSAVGHLRHLLQNGGQ